MVLTHGSGRGNDLSCFPSHRPSKGNAFGLPLNRYFTWSPLSQHLSSPIFFIKVSIIMSIMRVPVLIEIPSGFYSRPIWTTSYLY